MLKDAMIEPRHHAPNAHDITRIVVRPYASALPLGCFSFGIGNVLISCHALHWIPASDTPILAIMILAFVAPLELLPCVMAFLSRDTGGATAMGVFSAAWTVLGIQLLLNGPAATSIAVGVFLLLLAMVLIMLAVVTFPGKPLLGALLVVAVFRSCGAAFVEFGFGQNAMEFAAWAGLLLAAFAFYSGFAFLLEDVMQRPIAMTFRRKQAKQAVEGSLAQQIDPLINEAGVRQQL